MLETAATLLRGLSSGLSIARWLADLPAKRRGAEKRKLGIRLIRIYRASIDVERDGRAIVDALDESLSRHRGAAFAMMGAERARMQYANLARLGNEIRELDATTGIFTSIDDVYVAAMRRLFGVKIQVLGHVLSVLAHGSVPVESAIASIIASDEAVRAFKKRVDPFRLMQLPPPHEDPDPIARTALPLQGSLDRRKVRAYVKDAHARLDEIRALNRKLRARIEADWDFTELLLAEARP